MRSDGWYRPYPHRVRRPDDPHPLAGQGTRPGRRRAPARGRGRAPRPHALLDRLHLPAAVEESARARARGPRRRDPVPRRPRRARRAVGGAAPPGARAAPGRRAARALAVPGRHRPDRGPHDAAGDAAGDRLHPAQHLGELRPPTRLLNEWTMRADAADVAVSELVRSTVPPRLARRTETVMHGIDLGDVRAPRRSRPGPRRARDRAGRDGGRNRREPARAEGLSEPPAAAARLRDRGRPIRILAVGQGPLEARDPRRAPPAWARRRGRPAGRARRRGHRDERVRRLRARVEQRGPAGGRDGGVGPRTAGRGDRVSAGWARRSTTRAGSSSRHAIPTRSRRDGDAARRRGAPRRAGRRGPDGGDAVRRPPDRGAARGDLRDGRVLAVTAAPAANAGSGPVWAALPSLGMSSTPGAVEPVVRSVTGDPIPFNRPSIEGNEIELIRAAVEQSGHTSADGPYSARAAELLRDRGRRPRRAAHDVVHRRARDERDAARHRARRHRRRPVVRLRDHRAGVRPPGRARPVLRHRGADARPRSRATSPSSWTTSVRAVVPIHYAGVGCDVDGHRRRARRVAARELVEDNAHGLFGRYATVGRSAASAASPSLSFHETKNFICGEGGALIVNDADDVDRAHVAVPQGHQPPGVPARSGRQVLVAGRRIVVRARATCSPRSSTASSSNATTILAQAAAVFDRYQALLEPHAERLGLRLPIVPADCEQAYHMFYVLLPDNEHAQPRARRRCRPRRARDVPLRAAAQLAGRAAVRGPRDGVPGHRRRERAAAAPAVLHDAHRRRRRPGRRHARHGARTRLARPRQAPRRGFRSSASAPRRRLPDAHRGLVARVRRAGHGRLRRVELRVDRALGLHASPTDANPSVATIQQKVQVRSWTATRPFHYISLTAHWESGQCLSWELKNRPAETSAVAAFFCGPPAQERSRSRFRRSSP